MIARIRLLPLLLVFVGCAGMGRSCASCSAESFGADWVVVQMNAHGRPFRCWSLHGVSISNEEHSDGIYWREPSGNLVHVSNMYNRVQVVDGQWGRAYAELGVTRDRCNEIAAAVERSEHDR